MTATESEWRVTSWAKVAIGDKAVVSCDWLVSICGELNITSIFDILIK